MSLSLLALFSVGVISCVKTNNAPDADPGATNEVLKVEIGKEPTKVDEPWGTDGGDIGKDPFSDYDDTGFVETRTPAQLEVYPPSHDFEVQSLGSLNYVTFTVTNVGQKTATSMAPSGLTAPYTFRDGSYPGAQGSCGTTLNPGKSCEMVLTFQPNALQSYRLNTFKMNYKADDNDKNVSIPLDGTATDIATLRFWNLSDDEDFFHFGTLAYGSSSTKTIRVRYWGARPATGVSFSGLTAPFSIVSNTCADRVTADCELVVRFDSQSAGNYQQKLKVTYDNSSYAAEDNHVFFATSSPQVLPATLSISGQGGNNYGKILASTSLDRTFIVTKGGTLPATNVSAQAFSTAMFDYKGGTYPGNGGTCSETITASCTIVVTFTPQAVLAYADVIRLNFNDGNTARVASTAIAGSGAAPAMLTLTPANDPIHFGAQPVGFSSQIQFVLRNDSSSVTATALSLSAIAEPFAYIGGCGNSLPAGGQCVFSVRFRPSAAVTSNASFTVSYFDGTTVRSDLRRNLEGTGTDGAVLGSDITTYDFGSVFVGDSKNGTLTLRFYGVHAAQLGEITGVNSPFGFLGGSFPGTGGSCSTSISGNCSVVLTFTPPAAQVYTSTMTIPYEDGNGQNRSLSITLRGTGVLRQPAVLKITSAATYDFGNLSIGQWRSVTLTVTRTGNYNATSITAATLATPFEYVGGSYPGTGGNCGTTLSAASCTLVVKFSPLTAGLHGPTPLTLAYFDGVAAAQATVNLRGTGVDLAILTASTGEFTPTPMNQPIDLTVTVRNQGTRDATDLTVLGSLSAPFNQLTNGCTATLAAGASCTMSFRFSPTRPGVLDQSITLMYQSGSGSASIAIYLRGTGTVPVLVAANGNFTCSRLSTGQLKCWGQNNYGQLGLGDVESRLTPAQSGVVALGANRYPVQIAAGHFHACAVLDNGALKCWGMNLYGEIGLGRAERAIGDLSNEMGDNLASVNLGNNSGIRQLALGYAHSCALFNDGNMKCWGDNSEGQLGLGDAYPRGLNTDDMGTSLPAVDLGGRSATQITAHTSHTCARLDNGAVKCWGNNFFGQLGLGDFRNRGDQPGQMGNNLPEIDLGAGKMATQIKAGGAFTCAILTDGNLKCWGRNENGIQGRAWCQNYDGDVGLCTDNNYPLALRGYGIGDRQMGDALPPLAFGTGRRVVSLETANSSACAILDNGAFKCWGQNHYGQLGYGDTDARGLTDAEMSSLPSVAFGSGLTASTFTTGNFHTCALLTGGQIKCWGYNRYGALGIGDIENRGDNANEMGYYLPFPTY